jgi:hypothetical protein
MSVLVDKAAHFIRFHRKPLHHHITVRGDRLDMEMIRQGLEALDQETQEPLECDTHRTTDAAQRDPLDQQVFDERSCVGRDEVLFEAVDKLTAAVMALMVLFAVVDVAIFLVPGRLTPWTLISDDHRLLLTSAGVGSVWVNSTMESLGEHYMSALPTRWGWGCLHADTGSRPWRQCRGALIRP